MSFKNDIAKFTEKAQRAATMVLRGTFLDLSASIFKRSPVDKGRFRGNWQTEINSFPTSEVETTAAQAISRNASKTKKAKLTDALYLVNNLPYAIPLERGHSRQAPRGMVAVTIAAFKRIVDRNAKKAKR